MLDSVYSTTEDFLGFEVNEKMSMTGLVLLEIALGLLPLIFGCLPFFSSPRRCSQELFSTRDDNQHNIANQLEHKINTIRALFRDSISSQDVVGVNLDALKNLSKELKKEHVKQAIQLNAHNIASLCFLTFRALYELFFLIAILNKDKQAEKVSTALSFTADISILLVGYILTIPYMMICTRRITKQVDTETLDEDEAQVNLRPE